MEALGKALESVKKDSVLSGAENWSSWLLDCVGGEVDVKKTKVVGSPNF